MTPRKPKYRKHSSDRGFLCIDKKRIYLPGPYNSAQSLAAYERKIQAWEARQFHDARAPVNKDNVTLGILAERYLDYAAGAFGVEPRSSFHAFRRAIRFVTSSDGLDLWALTVKDFGPLRLKELQEFLVNYGAARETINGHTGKIKTWIKWCVSEELCEPSIYQALAAVRGLAKGRTAAVEPPKRQPAEWRDIQPVLRHLQPIVRDMLWLQWYSGARSGSICQAKPEQFTKMDGLLVWRPRHKTEHLEREVVLVLGPRCQAHMGSYLNREPGAYCFDPREGRNGGNKRYRDHYDPDTYRRSLERAQRMAQEYAEEKDSRYSPVNWSPHQLRHARGTLVRDRYGAEGTAAVLGHAQINMAEHYSQKALELAKRIARDQG